MATPYAKIRNLFLDKVTDYNLPLLINSERDSYIDSLLFSSCANFPKCKTDLSDRDNELEQFNNDLTDEVSEILVAGMLVEWIKPRVLNTDMLANYLNQRDRALAASPANMLNSLKDLLRELKSDFEKLKTEYTYLHGNANELTS